MGIFSRKAKEKNKNPFGFIKSFSKIITAVWILIWIEVVVFSQIATVLQLGDATSIQVINDNTKEIGIIICGAYFGSKCFENIARGYEQFQLHILGIKKQPEDDESIEQ